jgi:DMSO/TMAO reductase YedYZ molybdopterin-dependent catalytic subunit
METSVTDKDSPVVDARPTDRDRVPPRQVKTEKWPVLHYGDVPRVDLASWSFTIRGLVGAPIELTYDEIKALPVKETLCDIHCVTRWSRLDNKFTGVSVQDLLRRAKVDPSATHVLVHAEQGFTTNLPLSDLDRPENLLAWAHNDQPLSPDHGWPLRLLVPHLYFWKSAKWVRGFELLDFDLPGFWEQNGYHMRGDPWAEERYGGMSITQAMINKKRTESKTR